MLQQFANSLSESKDKKHLFVFVLALISVCVIGYHYGTFDQSIHIPFLKAFADPSLYPNDPFVAMRHEHYSYFWLLFVPFYQMGILEPVLFITHIMATFFTFWMIYDLCEILFKNPMSSLFGTLAFVFPHLSFAGFPLIEFSLLNRTFVMPFLLLAINLYLRGIRARSFFMLGILYNLHVLSVHFVLALFALDFVLEYKKVGWKKIINCLVVFVIAALPVLLWKLQDSGTEIHLEPDWFNLISRTMMMHLFFITGNYYTLIGSMSALSAYGLFLYAYHAGAPRPHDHTVMIFMLATALVILVQVIVAAWLPISIILQLQIIRIGIIAVVFGYLYFADFLARKWQDGGLLKPGDKVLTVSFFLSTLTFNTLIIIFTRKWWAATPGRIKATGLTLAIAFVISLGAAIQIGMWDPGLNIYGRQTPWRDVQEWARDNTPKDAIFITPMTKWWLNEAEWRVFSERQNISSLSEILEAAFEPEYMRHWQPRFEALAPGALARFRGDYPENRKIVDELYNNLSTESLKETACKYGASYLVVQKPVSHNLPELYENSEYRIYDMTQQTCP